MNRYARSPYISLAILLIKFLQNYASIFPRFRLALELGELYALKWTQLEKNLFLPTDLLKTFSSKFSLPAAGLICLGKNNTESLIMTRGNSFSTEVNILAILIFMRLRIIIWTYSALIIVVWLIMWEIKTYCNTKILSWTHNTTVL